MKVVYFGTPHFAANVLSFLLAHGIEIIAVVTKPDRSQGRSSTLIPTPVKCIAETQIPPLQVFQPEIVSAPEHIPYLKSFNADLFVVVAYGEIIKQHLLDMPKVACINVHASLLPKYRGAAPIQRCIINGEVETGITLIHMAKKMDAGDIISMEKVEIGSDTTYGELEEQLCKIGCKQVLKVIHDFETGKATRTPQDHSLATLAPKIELEDSEIDWSKSAQEIHNLVRGVNPHPGAWCHIKVKGQDKRLKIFKTKIVSLASKEKPGQICFCKKNGLIISCGQGEIKLLHVQLEGKKAMSAEELMRGLHIEDLELKQ
jgi:methionyl-tRNA formyltransferase